MAGRGQAGPGAGALAGLAEGGHNADEGGHSGRTAKARRIAKCSDEPGGGLRADPRDGRQQRADLVIAQGALDVPFQGAQSLTEQREVFTGVADLQTIGFAVMPAHGARGRRDQPLGQLGADLVAAVVDEPRQALDRHTLKGQGAVGYS